MGFRGFQGSGRERKEGEQTTGGRKGGGKDEGMMRGQHLGGRAGRVQR